MSKREPILLIEDIIDSGQKILVYTDNLSFEDFINDSKTIDAVIRNSFSVVSSSQRVFPADVSRSGLRGSRISEESTTIRY